MTTLWSPLNNDVARHWRGVGGFGDGNSYGLGDGDGGCDSHVYGYDHGYGYDTGNGYEGDEIMGGDHRSNWHNGYPEQSMLASPTICRASLQNGDLCVADLLALATAR